MITAIIAISFTVLAAGAIYSRARLSLRRRASTEPSRPAFDLVRPSNDAGWHPTGSGSTLVASWKTEEFSADNAGDGDDLSRLFGQERR